MPKLSVFLEAIRIIRKSQVIACHIPSCGQADPSDVFGPCRCGYADYMAWSQRFLDEHSGHLPADCWGSTEKGGELTRAVMGPEGKP